LSTTLRSEIAKKKQLAALITEDDEPEGKLVLLRDPTDERYPHQPKPKEAPARWFLCRALTWKKPGHLMVLQHKYLAATSTDGTQWDALFHFDEMLYQATNELRSLHAWNVDVDALADRSPYDFWIEYIDEPHRAYLKHIRSVPPELILALDSLGDGHFPVPHILFEFTETTGPFTAARYAALSGVSHLGGQHPLDIRPDDDNRVPIFPNPLPSQDQPEPEGFDDTSQDPPPLSTASSDQLQAMLTKPAESRSPTSPDASARTEESRRRFHAFEQWRASVAQPVFFSFVRQLRSGGHRARVLFRSDQPLSADYAGFGSVELSVRLHVTSPHNPWGYHVTGRVAVSISEHVAGWRMVVSPSNERPVGHSTHSPSATISVSAATTTAQLEGIVLSMLDRLATH